MTKSALIDHPLKTNPNIVGGWKMTEEHRSTQALLDGRMKRRPYAILSPIAFCLPSFIAWAILYATNWGTSEIEWGLPLGIAVFSITAITQLVATGILMVRRANDCGKDRSLVALLLIPVANIGVLIYLMFPASVENAENQWYKQKGKNPWNQPAQNKVNNQTHGSQVENCPSWTDSWEICLDSDNGSSL
jgi:uncharacterized membrane protein YhaH (DUF805 family)